MGPKDPDPTGPDAPDLTRSRPVRLAFRAAQILVILPVWVAAIRDGHNGWYPTLDAATTVLRARDVFSANFPLIGMWSSVSTKIGLPTYFPGATELYYLAIPIRLLGNAWGPLIGMAVLNSAWLLLATWLLRRRLGTLGGVWSLLALALLVWTMGSEALVDVAPMQMITIPFALFLIAVWSVADRDLAAIPLLAFVANFLLLNHLVLTMLVPVIGLVAPIALFITLRSARRDDPGTWPELRHRVARQLLVGVVITIVLWVPTLIQQFQNSPGNLTNLYNASRVDLSRTVSVSEALNVIVSMVSEPPFWLRNTFITPLGATSASVAQLVIAVVIVAVMTFLGVLAARRRDRTTLTALIIAGVALIAGLVNILMAPTDFGFKRGYFRSLWGTMMFAWLAVAVALVQALRGRVRIRATSARAFAAVGVAATLVVSLVAMPHQNPGKGTNGSSDASVALAQRMVNRAVVLLRNRGQVQVSSAGDFTAFGLSSTLILALDSYGVDVCVPPEMVGQYGDQRACDRGGPDVYATVTSAAFPPFYGEKVVMQATLLTPAEQRTERRLGAKVRAWLATQTSIHSSPRVRKILIDAYGPDAADRFDAKQFATAGLPLETLATSPPFVEYIVNRSEVRPDGSVDAAIVTGKLPPEDLVRWATLVWREYTGESVRVVTTKTRPGLPASPSTSGGESDGGSAGG